MAEIPMNHGDICRLLRVPQRQPTDNPIVGKATEVEILVEGKRIKKWGGSARCLYCDYEVSSRPDIAVCPGCGAGSVKCAVCTQELSGLDVDYHYSSNHPGYDASAKINLIQVTCSHCGTDQFVEPGHPPDALHCIQCGRSIALPQSEEE